MHLKWIGLVLVLLECKAMILHTRRLVKMSFLQWGAVHTSRGVRGGQASPRPIFRREYHQPRYLSSATLLAEWCYGSYDDLGLPEEGGGLARLTPSGNGGALDSSVSSDDSRTHSKRMIVSPLQMSSISNPNVDSFANDDGGANLGFTPEEMEMVMRAQASPEAKKDGDVDRPVVENNTGNELKVERSDVGTITSMDGQISIDIGKADLREEMRGWRKLYSEEYQVPVYTVFSNKVLDGILEHMPVTEEELRALPGVGEKTLQKIKGKVLPLVKQVLDGKPVTDDFQFSDNTNANASMATSALASSRTTRKARHTARMAAILANLESQQTINSEDLNDEQVDASEIILEGQNTFITGSAGTGKSFLLRYLVQELREKHGANAVAVTASTGIAAINLGGQTVHSYAGIGLSTGSADNSKVINKVLKNMRAVKRWQDAKVLIIDEISMIDRPLFELLDMVARAVRRNDEPFGGIQIIVVGDFFQLPPVPNKFAKSAREFCFESPVWNRLGFGYTDECGYMHCNFVNMVTLKQVVRQSDVDFANLLNEIRIGEINNRQLDVLNSCVVYKKPPPTDGIVPTKLYSINKDVDKENLDRLMELPGEVVEVSATDVWQELPSVSSLKKTIKENIERAIPEKIQLKVGAQVMLLRNRNNNADDQYGVSYSGLVNGSRGVITGFVRSSSASGLVPRVCFDNGQEVVIGPVEYFSRGAGGDGHLVRSQVPLKLAWAVTIHKSQGTTLSRAELMLSNTFDYGQAYVALSRVSSFDGLWLTEPLQKSNIRANSLVLNYFAPEAVGRDITPE